MQLRNRTWLLGLLLLVLWPTTAAAGRRATPNPAWLAALELARAVRQAPQATEEELRELDVRLAPLAAEQRRLMAEARWLDAEEERLAAVSAGLDRRRGEFEGHCAEIATEEQLEACRALQTSLQADIDAYNALYRAFMARHEPYRTAVLLWVDSVGQAGMWMRKILDRRAALTPAERRVLEQERDRLRAEIDGLQEALQRLARGREQTAEDRAEWEQRHAEAVERAGQRLREFLADKSIELAQAAIRRFADKLTGELRTALDERINVAGGSDPDKAARVKALDERIRALGKDRADATASEERLGRAWTVLKDATAATEGQPAKSRAEQIQAAADVVGELVSDPTVQRILRVSSAPADVFTYGKLLTDAAYDIAVELTAWTRIRAMDLEADAYLEAVRRLDEHMKSKVARLQEIQRTLGS